jgi:endonuclease/exonuclease/phosphatase family metal-dependent hydrolase
VFESPGELVRGFEANAKMRVTQWRELRDLIARRFADLSPRTVVAGDLNTLEIDPLLDEIRRDFVDAFRRTRWRLGATFPNLVPFPPWPVARIDYVLTTPAITPEHAEVLPAAGSDHLGVGVVLRMPQVKLDPARAREAAEPER